MPIVRVAYLFDKATYLQGNPARNACNRLQQSWVTRLIGFSARATLLSQSPSHNCSNLLRRLSCNIFMQHLSCTIFTYTSLCNKNTTAPLTQRQSVSRASQEEQRASYNFYYFRHPQTLIINQKPQLPEPILSECDKQLKCYAGVSKCYETKVSRNEIERNLIERKRTVQLSSTQSLLWFLRPPTLTGASFKNGEVWWMEMGVNEIYSIP